MYRKMIGEYFRMTFEVDVKDCPDWVTKDFKYIIATYIGGVLWYYGASNDYGQALQCLGDDSMNRILLKNGRIVENER